MMMISLEVDLAEVALAEDSLLSNQAASEEWEVEWVNQLASKPLLKTDDKKP